MNQEKETALKDINAIVYNMTKQSLQSNVSNQYNDTMDRLKRLQTYVKNH